MPTVAQADIAKVGEHFILLAMLAREGAKYSSQVLTSMYTPMPNTRAYLEPTSRGNAAGDSSRAS
jgi:hypothetical protein